MKRSIGIGMLAAALTLFGCSDNGTNSDGAMGRVSIAAFDAPPVLDYSIESIYLTVETVTALNVETDAWDTLGTPNETVDFLALVNGSMTTMADTSLPVGTYSQIRLLLGEPNQIVVDGTTYDLTVPSGTTSGVKLNVDFDIPEDGVIEMYVDFDAGRSLTVTGAGAGNTIGASTDFILQPVFKAFVKSESGSIAGTVVNASDEGVEHVMISAVASGDTTNTFTDGDGEYRLILPAGTYGVSAHARQGMVADTTYADVIVDNAVDLTGYDFVVQ